MKTMFDQIDINKYSKLVMVASVGELPVEDLQVVDLPVEDLPVDDLQVEDLRVEDLRVEDLPVEDLPVEDLPVEDLQVKMDTLKQAQAALKQALKQAQAEMDTLNQENELQAGIDELQAEIEELQEQLVRSPPLTSPTSDCSMTNEDLQAQNKKLSQCVTQIEDLQAQALKQALKQTQAIEELQAQQVTSPTSDCSMTIRQQITKLIIEMEELQEQIKEHQAAHKIEDLQVQVANGKLIDNLVLQIRSEEDNFKKEELMKLHLLIKQEEIKKALIKEQITEQLYDMMIEKAKLLQSLVANGKLTEELSISVISLSRELRAKRSTQNNIWMCAFAFAAYKLLDSSIENYLVSMFASKAEAFAC